MKTKEILTNIRESGGFDNFRNWKNWQVKEWVKSTFDCSPYVAQKVANYLLNN